MEKVTETIVQFKVSEKAAENAWGDLVNSVAEWVSLGGEYKGEPIKGYLRPFEDEYMVAYHSDDPKAKKKNGTWKYSKYLPNAYRSAKSVLCRAADVGTAIRAGGLPLGKSFVERQIQERSPKKTKDVYAGIAKSARLLREYKEAGFVPDVDKALIDNGLMIILKE